MDPNPVEAVRPVEQNSQVHKGRFGFYSCSYETFLKVKRLYKAAWEARYGYGSWWRWRRKAEQNRVIRRWKYNDKGQKVGCEILGPMPEPKLSPVFVSQKHVLLLPDGSLNQNKPFPCINEVWHAIMRLRREMAPVATAAEVLHMSMSEADIDALLRQLEGEKA